jgi:hypothetical protein
MNLSPKLDSGCFRKLTSRLYDEDTIKADPLGCVFGTLDWLDRVTGTAMPVQGSVNEAPAQNDLIRRLGEIIKQRGAGYVAEQLAVSPSALKSWLRGVRPTESNRKRIEQFLSSETSPTDAAGAKESKPGELFGGPQSGRQQEPELGSYAADKQSEATKD